MRALPELPRTDKAISEFKLQYLQCQRQKSTEPTESLVTHSVVANEERAREIKAIEHMLQRSNALTPRVVVPRLQRNTNGTSSHKQFSPVKTERLQGTLDNPVVSSYEDLQGIQEIIKSTKSQNMDTFSKNPSQKQLMDDNIVFLGKQLVKEPKIICNLQNVLLPNIETNKKKHNFQQVLKRGPNKKVKLVQLIRMKEAETD